MFKKLKNFLFSKKEIPKNEIPTNNSTNLKVEMIEECKKEMWEKIFEEAKNSKPNNQFESLPKVLLSKILGYLDIKNIAKLFLLNKFFLKFLSDKTSPSTNRVWRGFIIADHLDDENELEDYMKNYVKTGFEEHMNPFYVFYKVKKFQS